MDKMEILKLAFSKAGNGKEAMELAREIEVFLRPANPVPKWVTETVKGMGEPLSQAPEKPANYRRSWTPEELARLLHLMQEGKTVSQMAEIMGRSHNSIDTALDRLNRGEYVTLAQQVNAGTFPGQVGAVLPAKLKVD